MTNQEKEKIIAQLDVKSLLKEMGVSEDLVKVIHVVEHDTVLIWTKSHIYKLISKYPDEKTVEFEFIESVERELKQPKFKIILPGQ